MQQSKQININLSQLLEQHPEEIVRQAQRNQWLAENKIALDEYNRRIEMRGVVQRRPATILRVKNFTSTRSP